MAIFVLIHDGKTQLVEGPLDKIHQSWGDQLHKVIRIVYRLEIDFGVKQKLKTTVELNSIEDRLDQSVISKLVDAPVNKVEYKLIGYRVKEARPGEQGVILIGNVRD